MPVLKASILVIELKTQRSVFVRFSELCRHVVTVGTQIRLKEPVTFLEPRREFDLTPRYHGFRLAAIPVFGMNYFCDILYSFCV